MRLSIIASLRNDHVSVNMSVLHAGESFSLQEAQRLSGQLDNSSQSYLNELKNKEINNGSCRDKLVVRSICCSWKGPIFWFLAFPIAHDSRSMGSDTMFSTLRVPALTHAYSYTITETSMHYLRSIRVFS